jgi:hypothetical protein
MRTDQSKPRLLLITAAVLSAFMAAGCATADKPSAAKSTAPASNVAANPAVTSTAATDAAPKAPAAEAAPPAVQKAKEQGMPDRSVRFSGEFPPVNTLGRKVPMPLQPLADKPSLLTVPGSKHKIYYVPSSLQTTTWGYLPNAASKPVMTVPSGATVVFDTLSHEGILEDQGRDPVKYFGSVGVPRNMILNDAVAIASSDVEHDFAKDGPHVVTGPIAVEGAQPGDVLKVEILSIVPRVQSSWQGYPDQRIPGKRRAAERPDRPVSGPLCKRFHLHADSRYERQVVRHHEEQGRSGSALSDGPLHGRDGRGAKHDREGALGAA